jgi:hypothetical protein
MFFFSSQFYPLEILRRGLLEHCRGRCYNFRDYLVYHSVDSFDSTDALAIAAAARGLISAGWCPEFDSGTDDLPF